MSDSNTSEEETTIPVSKKRRKSNVVESSDSEEANNDVDNKNSVEKQRKSRKSKPSSSSDSDNVQTPKKKLQTPATRSSDRLRKKKEFSLPSREERLEIISHGAVKTSTRKMRELKPRRLVNNFIKE